LGARSGPRSVRRVSGRSRRFSPRDAERRPTASGALAIFGASCRNWPHAHRRRIATLGGGTRVTPLYLSRARLRREVPSAALRTILVPDGDSQRVAAGHKLVWTLFADAPERQRDFLWREAAPGEFYLLSRRPPADVHGLFDVDPPKVFAPALSA